MARSTRSVPATTNGHKAKATILVNPVQKLAPAQAEVSVEDSDEQLIEQMLQGFRALSFSVHELQLVGEFAYKQAIGRKVKAEKLLQVAMCELTDEDIREQLVLQVFRAIDQKFTREASKLLSEKLSEELVEIE